MLIRNSKYPEEDIRKKDGQRYYEVRENASQIAREYRIKRQRVKIWDRLFKM